MRLFEMRIPPVLDQHKGQIAKLAQAVYDEWDEDPDVYAGGGICHLIADKITGYLNDIGLEATTVSDTNEVHVWTAVDVPDSGIYLVDIRPYVYERGGGYCWTKIPDVEFDSSDVVIDYLGSENEKENWFGDW